MSYETMSATAKTAIKAYKKAPTEANRERLSDAMFALEATLLFPDNDFVYITALRLLMSHTVPAPAIEKKSVWQFLGITHKT